MNLKENLKLALSFHFFLENTRSCWPVRPIPRSNFLPDAINNSNEQPQNSSNGGVGIGVSPSSVQNTHTSNAAVGVVIPRTPNSTVLHQHQNQLNETTVKIQSIIIV